MAGRLSTLIGPLSDKIRSAMLWAEAFAFNLQALKTEQLTRGQELIVALFYCMKDRDSETATALINILGRRQDYDLPKLGAWLINTFDFRVQDVKNSLIHLARMVVAGPIDQYIIFVFCKIEEKYGWDDFFMHQCYIISGGLEYFEIEILRRPFQYVVMPRELAIG